MAYFIKTALFFSFCFFIFTPFSHSAIAKQGNSSALSSLNFSANTKSKLNIPAPSKKASVNAKKPMTHQTIILTIPGITPSSLWSYVLGKKQDGQRGLSGNEEDDRWMMEYFKLNSAQELDSFKTQMLQQLESESRGARDDLYLEHPIKNSPGFDSNKTEVFTFLWSRDASDSAQVVPKLAAQIKELSDKAKSEGKRFYIFAHSWGTVLSHHALHHLYRKHQPVQVDIWLTSGSPLVPPNSLVKHFVNTMLAKSALLNFVAQPANVRHWVNVWGKRDILSNFIQQCHLNFQTDSSLSYYEDKIKNSYAPEAISDWYKIKNPITWHAAYYNDFRIYLKSLSLNIYIPVFKPYIQPQLLK